MTTKHFRFPAQRRFPESFRGKACNHLPCSLIIQRRAITHLICTGWQPRGTQTMQKRLRAMLYGDALYSQNIWRLEWLQLNTGYPHFRLYYQSRLYGVVRMKSEIHREAILRYMAAYVTVLGCTETNSYLEYGGVKTCLTAKTERLPILFHVRFTGRQDISGKPLMEVTARGW